MRGKPIHVGRDVQKSVQGDGKINEHNCIIGGGIPTTMCIEVCNHSFILLCTSNLIII
jgi:hypothetical protein